MGKKVGGRRVIRRSIAAVIAIPPEEFYQGLGFPEYVARTVGQAERIMLLYNPIRHRRRIKLLQVRLRTMMKNAAAARERQIDPIRLAAFLEARSQTSSPASTLVPTLEILTESLYSIPQMPLEPNGEQMIDGAQ